MAIQIGQQGWSQQTPAAVQIIRSGLGAARTISSRRRSKRSKAATSRKRKKRAGSSSTRSKRSSRKVSRLVKGSAAAKAYMAKIRKLRK